MYLREYREILILIIKTTKKNTILVCLKNIFKPMLNPLKLKIKNSIYTSFSKLLKIVIIKINIKKVQRIKIDLNL